MKKIIVKKTIIIVSIIGVFLLLSGCSAPANATGAHNIIAKQSIEKSINSPVKKEIPSNKDTGYNSLFSYLYDTDRKRKRMKIDVSNLLYKLDDISVGNLSFA